MQTVTEIEDEIEDIKNEEAQSAKDKAAESLIEWHFYIDPNIQVVYRFFRVDEETPNEPIKLLDVNPATLPTGELMLFGFGPAGDMPYSCLAADVTPEEMERIRAGSIPLPSGWSLTTAKRYTRPGNQH